MTNVPPDVGVFPVDAAAARGLPPELGYALEAARLRRGLSCRAVAEAVGVDRSYVWLIEHGRRVPSRPLIRSLTEVLDLDPTTAALLTALARPEVS
jgi:transcriptional regulator with XRE-family HTH domain